jgi:class 3 adenylate cyclase/TolB-like protein/Tfp pilus assembly protein PilF
MDSERRELAAIMFTDIVGYATLVQKDEAKALRLLAEHRKLVRSALAEHGGREVKTIGDGFMIEFAGALQAARCALAIQKASADRNASLPEDRRVQVRVGLHVGDVVREGGDIVGDGVNIASRIEPMAEPGGICISQQVYDQVRNKLGVEITSMGQKALKHIDAPVTLYSLGTEPAPIRSAAPPPKGRNRLAVLPLASISLDRADDYFSEGLTEELISTLSRIPGLSVIARTSIMRFKGGSKGIAEVARELGVASVVEGSVRKAGSRVRITVQLVDAESEEPLWSQAYDRDISDIFAIQSDVAQQVAASLKVRLLKPSAREPGRPAADGEAYTLCLRGRYFWNRRTGESLRKAVGFFEKAIRRDPGYAPAYAGLADSYASLALIELVPPLEGFPKAKEAVLKALELEPGLAEAHASLGLIRFQFDRDWKGSEAELRKALALNPGYATAHMYYADLLKAMGRFGEALTEVRKALELDPLSLPVNTALGHVLYLSRDYDAAIEQYRRTVELDPNYIQTHLWFGRPYLQKGRYREAVAEIQKAVDISGGSTISLAVLGHALAASGDSKEALKLARTLKARARREYVPSYWIALIYVGLEDADEAFAWLGRAYDERSSWLAWVKVEPRFDFLREDRRYGALLKKMGLG